jgi:two-component system sensor histidine kinase HydH
VLASHALVEHCRLLQAKGELPVVLDQVIENEVARTASRKQREYFEELLAGLRALNSNLLIPLFDSDQILGFLILAIEAPPEPWGNNWGLLPVIYPYFEQAARAMRGLEIYTRQREKERLAALGEMAAGLAHEIRNPLGAIKGAAQFLDPDALIAENRKEGRFLNVIIEEVDRLNRVVTQFLDYSKPFAVDFTQVDLVELTQKTISLMKTAIPPDIDVEFRPIAKDAKVMASSGQIQQVLINLIQNSVKALEPSRNQGKTERKLVISVETDSEGLSPEAIVTVEDTGHGIKKENIEKLFIPFFTTSTSGTGLGLSISQKIVEAHRGRIELITEEGRFTRFFMILPGA